VITLINIFRVPAEATETFLAGWRDDQQFMAAQEGFLDGTMYRAADAEASYRFVNIARWRSQADMDTARQANTDRLQAAGAGHRPDEWARHGITTTPAPYEVEQQSWRRNRTPRPTAPCGNTTTASRAVIDRFRDARIAIG